MIEYLKLRERQRELVFYAALHHIYEPDRQGWVSCAAWDKEIAAGLDSAYHDQDY